MKTLAYYNEIDPFAAAWLEELMKAGEIAPGEVDTRSIEDVQPDDLAGFTQCHFFAGIGVWSYALRLAGWPDDRPIWTGSCPCQPFSSAGKGNGFADERHLWPAFFHLICQCNPLTVCGEQVASKDGLAWFDLVSADLEGTGYACGAIDTCAAGFGAPHIRQRLYWVANDQGRRWREEQPNPGRLRKRAATPEYETRGSGTGFGSGRLGIPIRQGLEGFSGNGCNSYEPGRYKANEAGSTSPASKPCRMGNSFGELPGPVNGLWRDADWLFCRDARWRPVRPGSFPLVNGATNRVGRLRGYGNAINASQAAEFIRAYMEIKEQPRR